MMGLFILIGVVIVMFCGTVIVNLSATIRYLKEEIEKLKKKLNATY